MLLITRKISCLHLSIARFSLLIISVQIHVRGCNDPSEAMLLVNNMSTKDTASDRIGPPVVRYHLQCGCLWYAFLLVLGELHMPVEKICYDQPWWWLWTCCCTIPWGVWEAPTSPSDFSIWHPQVFRSTSSTSAAVSSSLVTAGCSPCGAASRAYCSTHYIFHPAFHLCCPNVGLPSTAFAWSELTRSKW